MSYAHQSLSQVSWQQDLSKAFTSIHELCDFLQIDCESINISTQAADQFALKVPRGFAECMEKQNPKDPLLLQVLPVSNELLNVSGFTRDPVGDRLSAKNGLVLHKYHGRALLINSGVCAINCRYCFRRNFPYSKYQITPQKLIQAINYLKKTTSIHEVILSGGDPLLLNDEKLFVLLEELDSIDYLKRIRIHSRIPIVLPSRITDSLCQLLTSRKKQMVMVVHCNHGNEISPTVSQALQKLRKHDLTLLNQAVLLKEVNDNVGTLIELSEKLFAERILPYYIHLLDRAEGTAHFEVPEKKAIELKNALMCQLPGYLVPKFVKEVPGNPSKDNIDVNNCELDQ